MTTQLSNAQQQNQVQQQQNQVQQQQTQIQVQQQAVQQNVAQVSVQPSQNSCVFVECNALIDMGQERYDPTGAVTAPSALTQINYNIQPQNHIPIGGYSLQPLAQVQVYNSYAMPLTQQMTPAPPPPVVQGQIIGPPMQQHQQQNISQVDAMKDDTDKVKRRNGKIRKDGRIGEQQSKQVRILILDFFFHCFETSVSRKYL